MPQERIERDRKVPGLHVRHMATKSVWYLSYRTRAGKQRRPRLGDARVLSREEARRFALEMLGEVARGGDPSARLRPSAAPTVADLAARYAAEYAPRKKPRSQEEDRCLWARHVLPRLGALPVADLTRRHVADLHSAMRATPVRANRAVALLHKALELAIGWGWHPGPNPARVERYAEKPRRRVPSPDEGARLLAALDGWRGEQAPFCGLVELLILTGCRLREIMHARREWIVDGRLRLPDSKTGEKVIPLSSAALAAIARLPVYHGNPYLIPGRRLGQPLQSPGKLWRELLARAGVQDLRIHDLRRFYASMALGSGLSLEAVGQMLGHRQAQTTKVYAYLMDQAQREAAERTAAAITSLGSLPRPADPRPSPCPSRTTTTPPGG